MANEDFRRLSQKCSCKIMVARTRLLVIKVVRNGGIVDIVGR